MNYLFEKEGEIVLPAMEYMYWNSNTRKFYKKNIDSVLIQVKPNPDLSMLASIKKSLQKDTIASTETEEKPFLILGLTPKTFAKYLIFSLVILLVLIYFIKQLIAYIKYRREAYLRSEHYAFNILKKALNQNDYFAFIGACHTWLKRLNTDFESLEDLVKSTNSEALRHAHEQLNNSIFKVEKSNNSLYAELLKGIKQARSQYLKNQSIIEKSSSKSMNWLNPTSTD